MGVTMENNWFRAIIDLMGGELTSLVEKVTNTEYLWQADPAWWKGTAPILFPVIGGLIDGVYRYAGQTYTLPSHGFARNTQFTLQGREEDAATLYLPSNSETKVHYPFDFVLTVRYLLERSGISIRYDVTNTGPSTMYFSIGSHPAFNLPFAGGSLENYYLLFEQEEDLERFYFKDGLLVSGKSDHLASSRRIISVTRQLFDLGPLVFINPNSREFILMNSRNAKSVRVTTEGVPYLSLWSKPGGAPFVCIEPWYGIPDWTDASGDLQEKAGIIPLEPDAIWCSTYSITVEG